MTILLERRVRDLRWPSYSPLGLVPQTPCIGTYPTDCSWSHSVVQRHRSIRQPKKIYRIVRERLMLSLLTGGSKGRPCLGSEQRQHPRRRKSSSIPLSTSACRGCTFLTSDTLDSPRRLASGSRSVRDSRFSRCCDVEDDGRPLSRTRSLRALRRRAYEPFETGHLDDCVSGSASDYETEINVTKRKAG